jgi:hypothetical protein
MTAALEAIFWISGYMMALTAIFIGLGLWFQKLFGASPINVDRILTAFWVGFAIAVCFLQVWHLFLAVTGYALAILTAAAIAGIAWNADGLAELLQALKRRDVLSGILCSLAIMAWVANNSAGPPVGIDDGIYHIPTVRWNVAYPVVLGLGNLHDRLAFNNSSLLYGAMLEWGPWAGRAVHIDNALLVWILFVRILVSGARLARAEPADVGPCVFDMVLLAPVIAITISTPIASFAPDVAVAITLLAACSSLYRLLTIQLFDMHAAYDGVVVVMLAAVAICLKASAIVISPILVLIVLVFLFLQAPRKDFAHSAKWIVGVSSAAIVPWIIHGLLLSGYPLYPSTFGGLAVDWKLPAELATATRLFVVAYARNSIAAGFAWVPEWFAAEMHWRQMLVRAPQWSSGVLGLLIPFAIALLCLFVRLLSLKRERKIPERGWWLSAGCAMSVAIWFFTVPAPRFGFTIFWSLAAATAAEAASHVSQARVSRVALLLAAAVGLLPVLFPLRDINTIVRRMVVPPGPDHGLHPYPEVETHRFETQSGLSLLVPNRKDACFNAPLPCTPHPAPNVALLQPHNGRPKFVTNGAWEQINWPNSDRVALGQILKARAQAELKR